MNIIKATKFRITTNLIIDNNDIIPSLTKYLIDEKFDIRMKKTYSLMNLDRDEQELKRSDIILNNFVSFMKF